MGGGWQDRGEHTTLTVTDTVTDGKAIYRYRNLTEAKILLLLGAGGGEPKIVFPSFKI